jgi:hypothetical protein
MAIGTRRRDRREDILRGARAEEAEEPRTPSAAAVGSGTHARMRRVVVASDSVLHRCSLAIRTPGCAHPVSNPRCRAGTGRRTSLTRRQVLGFGSNIAAAAASERKRPSMCIQVLQRPSRVSESGLLSDLDSRRPRATTKDECKDGLCQLCDTKRADARVVCQVSRTSRAPHRCQPLYNFWQG